MNDYHKGFVIVLLFSLFFFYLGVELFDGGDFNNHLQKASVGCPEDGLFEQTACLIYAPLYSIISGPFAFHENAFFFFALFLVGIITPLLLYHLSRSWVIVFFYFTITNYSYYFLDGIFPQALAHIILLLVFVSKDYRLDLGLLLLGSLAHGHGFVLVLVALLSKYSVEWASGVFPACSGITGKNVVPLTSEPTGLVSHGNALRYGDILHFLFKVFPFPFLLMGLVGLRERERLDYVLMVGLGMVGGLFVSARIFYVSALFGLIGLAWFFEGLKKQHKAIIILLAIIMGLLNIYWFIQYKVVCAGENNPVGWLVGF